jgi:hypothetical protein
MINRTTEAISDPLRTELLTNDGATTYMEKTPYGTWRNNFAEMLEDVEKRRRDLEIDDPDSELPFAECVRKAIEEDKAGNPRELMRLMIPAFFDETEQGDVMNYDNIPTPQEARAIFMKMGEKVFEYNPKKSRFQLERLWKASSVHPCPESFVGPGPHNAKALLKDLEWAIHSVKVETRSPLAHVSRGEDMKLLWTMLKVQDDLNRELYGRASVEAGEKRQIDEQRAKLN